MRLAILVAIVSIVTTSCGGSSTRPPNEFTKSERSANTLEVEYGNCPEDPNAVCSYFHGMGAVATGVCTYGECFDMSYGEATRVVAADELGAFPSTFFLWVEDASPVGTFHFPCVLTKEGQKKTRVQLPEGSPLCAASLQLGTSTYYEHFSSDPQVGCLAWLECKVPTP